MLATSEEAPDVTELSLADLEAELATLAAHLYAGTCRWLELVAELDRREGWAEDGCGSCAEWIAWRCALTPRSAREHVRVARCLAELPETHAELLELSRLQTAQLERTVRLAPEDGALLLRALDALRDSTWRDGRGSAEPRAPRQASNAEALVAVAESALAHEGKGRPGGERYQIVVHADRDVLTGGCELEEGSPLAPETARRLSCDASVVRDGRRTRTIPPAVRRALRRRDRGCRFPGCENRRFVDAHHVKHWAHGGETTVENLVLLCRRHHRAVHEGGYRVDSAGRFFNPWGKELAPAPPLPGGDPSILRRRTATACDTGIGERLDLAATVDAMLAIDRRARLPTVVEHGLGVVTVGVEDERAVVAGVIPRALAG